MRWSEMKKETPICPAPKRKSEDVLAVSQVVEWRGHQILNLDLYYMGVLEARYFADREERTHAAYIGGGWVRCSIKNVARMCKSETVLKGDYYYFNDEWRYAEKTDKQRAEIYLESGVEWFESEVRQLKYERAYQRKCQRIDEEMRKVPAVPEDAERWLEAEIFPGHYLFFEKKGSRTTYSCTACGAKSWRKKPWKHGEQTVCPRCGTTVKAYSRKTKIERKKPVVLLQAYDEKWAERQFAACCRWTEGKKEIVLWETLRAVMEKGKRWGKLYYGMEQEAEEFEQEWWDKNQRSRRFQRSYLYPGNLKEVLPCGGLERSGLDKIARAKEKINVNKFVTNFREWPWLEYLAKAGLYRLTADCVEYGFWGPPEEICTYGRSLQGLLQIDGNRVSRMKRLNGSLNTLRWLQREEDSEAEGRTMRVKEDALEYLTRNKISPSACEEILEALGSVTRLVNYLKKQRMTPGSAIQTWGDYLNMAETEGLNLNDDIVRLPRDLKARHDELVERINERRDAEWIEKKREEWAPLDRKIQAHREELTRYRWQNEEYKIIPATCCEELVKEGRRLHHCVGNENYMRKMAAGETWILFLRRSEAEKKPYYTVEIDCKTDKILQYYSEYDRQPGKETIRKILEAFRGSLKREKVA